MVLATSVVNLIEPSERVRRLPTYAVAAIAERKRALVAAGVDVIDLGAGDPDIPVPEVAVKTLEEAARDPRNSRYAFQTGSAAFRDAIASYMTERFGVSVDPATEILPLIGSKEGLAHLPFSVLDPGDVCVVPQPGYPAYLGGAVLAGADPEIVPLNEGTGFLVELEELPSARLKKTRLAFLNYPNNPTGAVAPRDYLERTIETCHRHGIVLAYDNPYVEIGFDGYRAPSILEMDGARDVAVEFHSFSKTFCMTGWRLGWVVGNSYVIQALSKVKTYVDTGAFLAVQVAGAAVLKDIEHLAGLVRGEMQRRRDSLTSALATAGFPVPPPPAGMYLWVRLPDGIKSNSFAEQALEEEGLAVLSGSVFGEAGEGYVRLSFTVGPTRLEDAAARFTRIVNRMAPGVA